MRFDLSDEEWTLLEPLMPRRRKSARVDGRKVDSIDSTGDPDADLEILEGVYGDDATAR